MIETAIFELNYEGYAAEAAAVSALLADAQAKGTFVAKINALRVRGVNYEDGVPARQLIDRAEVLALLGGAS